MSKARDLASRTGFTLITPGSLTVNSGTGSYGSNGLGVYSGASGVILNNVFNSTYESYKIIANIVTSGTSQDFYFQLRNGTSVSSALYYQKSQAGTGARGEYAAGPLDYWNMGRTGTYGGYFELDLLNPAKTQRKWFTSKSSDQDRFVSYSGGYADDTSTYDGFRFTGSSGGVLAGNIRVYGYNNG